MANPHMINIALDMFAATFNKKDEWKQQSYPVWEHGLEKVKDVHLHKAILNICMKKHQYPPTLGHLMEEVKDVIRELGGTGVSIKEYHFCDDCLQREGIREVSAHFLVIKDKQHKIHNCVTRCTCQGASDKYPVMGTFKDLQTRMMNDARITLLEWHMTDGAQPVLRMQQRQPHHYARMKRVQAEREKQGIVNPWAELAQRMVDGRYVPDQENIAPMSKPVDTPQTKHYNHTHTNIDPDDCIY